MISTFILYWLIVGSFINVIICFFMKETNNRIFTQAKNISKETDTNEIFVFVMLYIVTVILWPSVLYKIFNKKI